MIVCICEGVSDREIDEVIVSGAQSPAEVGAACGAGTDCGGCQGAIAKRIERASGGDCRSNCARRMAEVGSAASP